MKQLSTRGHTARATEKEELYKSIVDVDGNLLKPDVLEQFEANANKMKQLNKEYEEQKKHSGLGGRKTAARASRIWRKPPHRKSPVLPTASWQKSEIF